MVVQQLPLYSTYSITDESFYLNDGPSGPSNKPENDNDFGDFCTKLQSTTGRILYTPFHHLGHFFLLCAFQVSEITSVNSWTRLCQSFYALYFNYHTINTQTRTAFVLLPSCNRYGLQSFSTPSLHYMDTLFWPFRISGNMC